MAHLRQQIRERIGTDVTGLSTTGSNVFQSRIYPVEDGSLPCLLVYSTSEDSEVTEMASPRPITRVLNVVIQGVSGSSTHDDSLDTISKEVEVAMSADIGINSLATDSYLSEVEISYSGEGSVPMGSVRMVFTINYRHPENQPDTVA